MSIPGPSNTLRTILPNGITLLIYENPYTQSVAFNGYLPCGAFLDPKEKTGLSYLTSNCLHSGTRFRDFDEINDLQERIGASLSFGSGTHTIGFHGRSLSEDLPMLLTLLKESLSDAVFPEQFIEIKRQQFLTGWQMRLHDTESMSGLVFDETIYGEHPYARPIEGTPETILFITREDILQFKEDHIGPKGMVLSIAGGINAVQTASLAEELLGGWEKPQKSVDEASFFPEVRFPTVAIRKHHEIPDKMEMNLIVGTLGPARNDPDYNAARIGNSILGEFGMMGRIGNIVREENGLAYYAGSQLDSEKMSGTWAAEAGVNIENTEKALELIRGEFKRFTDSGVTDEELSDVKSYIQGSRPMSYEGNGKLAFMLKEIEFFGLGLDYCEKLTERINAVTKEDILRVARKWLDPDRLLTVTAGTKP